MSPFRFVCFAFLVLSASSRGAIADPPPNLLFENLRKLGNTYPVDDPTRFAADSTEGPKGLAAADLDGDGWKDIIAANKDGSVAVLFGQAGGTFEAARFLPTGSLLGLRDVITANVSGDGRPEIIAAHPFEGKLYIFSINGAAGSRSFSAPKIISTWLGARAVVAGDFDGDGIADLLVAGAGDGVREYRGNGAGEFTALPPFIGIDPGPFSPGTARPVFSLYVWRHPGESGDRLALTFADSGVIWFLASPAAGQPLAIRSILQLPKTESIFDLTMGFISPESRASGEPDLLTAVTGSGEVFIRRSSAVPYSYPVTPQVRLAIPGAPRALAVTDVNGDSWPDLLVASRNSSSLSLFVNAAGVLKLTSQTYTGSSPRDVTTLDLDANGLPDAVVINRYSEDISLHRIDPATGWFYQNPAVQRVPGGGGYPSVWDLDQDGRGELLYLTTTTGDANIRKIDASGRWLAPARYYMGARPQSLGALDVNRDGLLDLVATSLGDSQTPGGMSYRLQAPDHTFGPLTPGTVGGPMFGEVNRDFDGDGLVDRVVVYTDCRISFFQGTGNGFVLRRTEQFLYESRGLFAADLDGDGDLDLVGAGAYGDVAVVENNGRWFTGGPYRKILLGGGGVLIGAYAVDVADHNGDGYPDVTVLARSAVSRWNGGSGLTFEFDGTTTISNTLSSLTADFDGDGIDDQFALCPANTSAAFFKGVREGDGRWWNIPFVPYGVPAVDFLAAGDLDGDGRPDLVGIGEFLWAALSGTPSPAQVPTPSLPPPIEVPSVIINEVIAKTTDYIAPGASKPVDCVEIFNGTGVSVNLGGWKLRRAAEPGSSAPADFVFPNYTLSPRGFVIVYCTGKENTAWNAPFHLLEDGSTLTLLNGSGQTSDLVSYPGQLTDVSYARLWDGARSFVYNPFPNIGSTNYDNGDAPPQVTFKGLDTTLLKSGKWRFRAEAWSPNGMFTLMIHWREITAAANPRTGTIPLYDDGLHDDGGSLDSVFAGDWLNPLPAGVAIEFFISGIDLRWMSSTEPKGPDFTAASQPIENYTIALPPVSRSWEISEVLPRNKIFLDDKGLKSDWVEIRYTGPAVATVQDLFLSDSLFGYNPLKLYDVSRLGATVSPGTSKIVYLDDTPYTPELTRHAAFSVDGTSGDSIYLLRRLASGATEFVDSVKVPALAPNVAYARLGPGGPFVETLPTPEAPNAPAGGSIHFVLNPAGGIDTIFAYSGAHRVDASSDLQNWATVAPLQAVTPFERTYREPAAGTQRFFRTR